MKNAIQKLFSLLGKCSEDDDKATRLKLLASITLSSDYKELSQAVAFKKPFEENYSIPILETLDISTLIQRKKILHKLVAFHSKLLQSIRFGNGPELSSKDLPDFTSSSSLTKTLKTIRLSNVPTNYSNISDETALELFSDNSVKSARECLERLPVSLTSHETISEEEINKAMGNTYYCVSIEEFKKVHREFLSFFSKGEQIVLDERIRRRKHSLLKATIIMLCFGAVYAFSQFGFLSESFVPSLYGFVFFASIIYMIWG